MKLIDFIICDDIRSEVNNKLTAVGVYNSFKIKVDDSINWPLLMRLAILLRFKVEEIDPRINRYELNTLVSGDTVNKLPGTIQYENGANIITIALIANQFKLTKIGKYDFQLKLFSNEILIGTLVPDISLEIIS